MSALEFADDAKPGGLCQATEATKGFRPAKWTGLDMDYGNIMWKIVKEFILTKINQNDRAILNSKGFKGVDVQREQMISVHESL